MTPAVTQHRLDNGLRILLWPESRLPLATVCVWYDVGARDEPVGRTGLAHLFEHMMFQGSANVGPNEHAEYVQNIGGAANGDTTLEATYFVQTVPSHHIAPVLWLEADRMATIGTSVSQGRLDNQRAVVINERRQRYDSKPAALAWEAAIRMAHPEGHPYGHMPAGSIVDLTQISLDDVRSFADRYYTPGNAVLAVVGDIDIDQVLSLTEQYFGRIPAGGPVLRRDVIDVRPPEPTDVEQKLVQGDAGRLMVYRVPAESHCRAAALEVGTAVLGSGRHGWLRRTLVDGRALAQTATAGLLALVRSPSMVMIEVRGVDSAAMQEIGRVVRDVLAALAADGPSAGDLQQAKGHLQRRRLEQLSTTEGRAVELARGTVLHDNPLWMTMRAEQVAGIELDDVRDAVASYLLVDDCAQLVLASAGHSR